MVDVGGRRLHCFVYGSGGPTVVLVSGFQAPQEYWNPVVPGIAEITTVVTYDRAGYGKSERGDPPVHGRRSADDLHVLLGKLGVPKPYLLVGHSYGGRIVRLFASAYPADTAGLILEEAGHEDLPDAQLAALTGKDRETLAAMIAPYRTRVPDPRTETDYMPVTVEQLRESGPLPRVPLVVITAASRGSGLPPVSARRIRPGSPRWRWPCRRSWRPDPRRRADPRRGGRPQRPSRQAGGRPRPDPRDDRPRRAPG